MSSVASNQAASNSDEVSSPKYHAKRDLKFTFIPSFGFLFLAVLNTFGTSGTSYEYLFRPQPTNIYYDFMFVAICLGVAISDWTLYFLGIGHSSSNTYLFLKLLLPFVIGGILYQIDWSNFCVSSLVLCWWCLVFRCYLDCIFCNCCQD